MLMPPDSQPRPGALRAGYKGCSSFMNNACIIIVIFLVGMIGYGLPLSYTTRFRAFQGIPGFSYSWVTLSVPIGCALMLITAILKIKNFWRAISTGEAIAKSEGVSGEII